MANIRNKVYQIAGMIIVLILCNKILPRMKVSLDTFSIF